MEREIIKNYENFENFINSTIKLINTLDYNINNLQQNRIIIQKIAIKSIMCHVKFMKLSNKIIWAMEEEYNKDILNNILLNMKEKFKELMETTENAKRNQMIFMRKHSIIDFNENEDEED